MNIIINLGECTKEYKFPEDILKLKYSRHAKDRLVERTTGSLILAPKYVRMTKDNTIDISVDSNGVVIKGTVAINYKKGVKMYLPIALDDNLVKTVYFKNEKKYKISKRKRPFKEKVKECIEEAPPISETRNRDNVEDVPRHMGGKEASGWEELFRIVRRILRTRTPNYLL